MTMYNGIIWLNKEIILLKENLWNTLKTYYKDGEKMDIKRPGCPIYRQFSFNIADVEKFMKRGQNGGVAEGRKKSMMLACVDELALVAKTEEEMKASLGRFKMYVEKKKLDLNDDSRKEEGRGNADEDGE